MKKFYPNIRSVQMKVGLFTVIILLLLFAGYLWLTNQISTRSLQDLRVSFEDISGLEVGDKVMYRGMEVGRIKEIANTGSDIIVKARIHKDIRIPQGSMFMVGDTSLMGGKTLSIIPGTDGGWLSLDQVQKGEAPSGIMNIIAKASFAMEELQNIMQKIRKENGVIDKSENLLDDAGSAIRNVDSVTSELGQELSQTISRIDILSNRIDAFVKSNSDSLGKTISSTPATIASLQGTLDSLKTLSGQINTTAKKLNTGSGTASRILSDEELYLRLLQSVENLDALVKDVKANPKKYVKFSLF